MDNPSVILEAPNHAVTMLTELQALQKEQCLCDVRLTTDSGGISAHKLVLMATSPSMKLRLANGNLSNELIHFDNIPLNLLETVVQFMYTGKLNVDKFSLNQLLKFCEDLELSIAVEVLKDYIKGVVVASAEQRLEKENLSNKDVSNSLTLQMEAEDGDKTNKEDTTTKRSNRRVKQSPKKRTSKTPVADLADNLPEKLAKLSSEVIVQKILNAEHSAKLSVESIGRPRKSTLRVPTKVTKPKKVKVKYAGKKLKKEKMEGKEPKKELNVEYDSEGEKIYNYTQVTTERLKRTRTEVNALKTVISTNSKAENKTSPPEIELKEPKKEIISDVEDDIQNYSGDTETEQCFMDFLEKEKKNIKKEKKEKKKRVWKKRKPQPCSMCDKVLSTKKRLVFHEFCQHGIEYDKSKYKMFHCPVEGCGHVSSSRNNLRTHTRSRHTSERPHICEFCGKAFKLQNVLATHLNLHTGAKVFECKKCGERFNQHSGLDIHNKRYHKGESSWRELCHLCSEKFIRKIELCWHLFRVHKLPLPERYKAYTCDRCDFVTKKAQDFERHQNAHAGIKEWVCNICAKGCATKSELKRHVMYHGEKKFKCTFEGCSYACVDDLGLQKHIQLNHTHKHFKPYVCSVCKYKTGVKGNLDKHIRQVHNLDVVSKHTVPLKMKYKDFQQGDIITKDGQLVVSVQDREQLYKEELLLLQNSLAEKGQIDTQEDTRIRQITKSRKASVDRAKPNSSRSVENMTTSDANTSSAVANITASESTDTNAKLESEFTVVQPQIEKYENNQTISQSNAFQMETAAPLFGGHIYAQNQTIAPHMAFGLGAHDLRMGLGGQLGSPLYTEMQPYDSSMEHVDMDK